MSSVALWVKPGVGPTLKAFVDDYADPDDLSWMDVPNDDYASFLFNSEIEELAYAYRTVSYSIDVTAYPNTDTSWGYDPSGSTAANCKCAFKSSAGQLQRAQLSYDHLNPYPYRTILWRLRDNSSWRSVYTCTRKVYTGSSDARYVSYNSNDIPTTDVPNITFGVPYIGRVHRGGPTDQYDTNMWWNGIPDFGYIYGGTPPGDHNWRYDFDAYVQVTSPIDFSDIVISELPLENDPYPAVSGVYAEGVNTLLIDPTVPIAKMAKAGFDAAAATDDQCIFSSTKIPMKLAKTGSFTLAAGASVSIPIAYPVSAKCLVDYQVNITGQNLRLPPYPDNNTDEIKLQHRINAGAIEFQNTSSVSLDCRYFVLTMDGLGQSSGSAPIFDLDPTADSIIRVAGTAGTNDADIILDKRCAYLPVIAQDWVAAADITVASDVARYGTHKYTVNWTNSGFRPYVIARAKYEQINPTTGVGTGKYFWQDFFIKNIEIYSYFSASSFMAIVTDTSATFYMVKGLTSRSEDAYRTTSGYGGLGQQAVLVGFRYYVLAVPASL